MTKITRSKPVRCKAVGFIRQYLSTLSLNPGDKIPSVKSLAEQAGVSYVTMCKVMQELRSIGLVKIKNNRTFMSTAISAQGDENCAATNNSNNSSYSGVNHELSNRQKSKPPATFIPWQRAVERIRQDIVNRVFRPGVSLPSVKELETRYRITYRTVRKALRFLVDQAILESLMNGGYAVPSLSPGHWKTRIVCLVRSLDSLNMVFGTNDEAAFRALEGLCEQAQIKLDIHLICVKNEEQVYRQRDTGQIRHEEQLRGVNDDSVLGFAYFIPWQPTGYDKSAISILGSIGKPIVVVDESGMETLSPSEFTSKNLRIQNVATSPVHADALAHHLLRLGHKRIAFISTDHGYTWSENRLKQIASVYAAAGVLDGVVPFVAATTWDSYERGAQRCHFDDLYRVYTTWRDRLDPALRGDFDRHIENMRSDACRHMESRLLLLPLLDQALNDPTITAWVTSNDTTATMALEVLKEKGIHVSKDISLISFDDSPEAMRCNLSSYNFNAPAVGACILGYIVGRKPYTDKNWSVSGFIVDRGSTAKCVIRQNLTLGEG